MAAAVSASAVSVSGDKDNRPRIPLAKPAAIMPNGNLAASGAAGSDGTAVGAGEGEEGVSARRRGIHSPVLLLLLLRHLLVLPLIPLTPLLTPVTTGH